jgi:hypothetical protein
MTKISDIDHYYVCLGCDSRHPNNRDAIVCCAVVQEVWQCRRCDKRHPNLRLAIMCTAGHLREERDVEESAAV